MSSPDFCRNLAKFTTIGLLLTACEKKGTESYIYFDHLVLAAAPWMWSEGPTPIITLVSFLTLGNAIIKRWGPE